MREAGAGGGGSQSDGLESLSITTIRMLALDAVQKANSGHPGMPLGMAPAAYVLWTRFLKFSPENPFWPDRDRFVLSAGHGSALLYAMLHLTGHDMPMDELRNFRQWESKTPGHPEYLPGSGIETTTGPLGQGFATGVGMAMAEAHLAAIFNREGYPLVDHFTYAIASDGDMMEGIASEAASLAGDLKLNKLVYIYDSNHITLSADTRLTFTEDAGKRFEAYGWHVQKVADANDAKAIEAALARARQEAERPSLIIIRSHIGYGSPVQDTFKAHGSPMSPEQVKDTRAFYGWPPDAQFYVPGEVRSHMLQAGHAGAVREDEWNALLDDYGKEHPELRKRWDLMMGGRLPDGWDRDIPFFAADGNGIATRKAGGRIMNAISERVPALIGGSADLDPSTNTALVGRGSFQPPRTGDESVQGAVPGPWGYEAANIAYGVREHAMGGITNGLALHGGLLPFAATFFIFSDYMRPAMRLAALMNLRVIYVFTHDSVGLGQDGPTHEPVEHLASFRAMPNMTLIRPADANETAEAWRLAMTREGPVALILSRQDLPVLDRERYAPASGLRRGGYILSDSSPELPELVIIATGSEVHPALAAYEQLAGEGVKARLVSLPSWEIFEEQGAEYRRQVLPAGPAYVSVEAGAGLGWRRYVGTDGAIVSLERFGASAPGEDVLKRLGFSKDIIYQKATEVLDKR
ncbi:MAG: transketolase [Thermoleophilia bacterium]|nr:transketolase [Thermoleophilia bacterium]